MAGSLREELQNRLSSVKLVPGQPVSLLPPLTEETESMGRSPLTQVHTARKSWLSLRTPSSVDSQRFGQNSQPAARPQGPSLVLGIVPPPCPGADPQDVAWAPPIQHTPAAAHRPLPFPWSCCRGHPSPRIAVLLGGHTSIPQTGVGGREGLPPDLGS